MVVGSLKKGLKGALPVLIVFFILSILFSIFSVTNSFSDASVNVLYLQLSGWISSKFLIYLFNFTVLGLGAVLISIYTIKQEVVDKQNFLPSFIYLFLSTITLGGNLVHPSLIANIFILLALLYITDTYREEFVLSPIFNSALFISIAMFFYINYAFFIFLFFIALIILRPFNWREWLVGLLGLIAPVFIYCCLGYLLNYNYSEFFNHLGGLFYYFQKPIISEYFYPLFGYLILLLLLGLAKHFANGLGSKIKTQKNFGIIYWLMVLSLINFISKNNNYYFPLIASVIPISILLSDYFYNIKQLKIANTLFFLLLLSGSLLFLMNLNII